MGRHEQNPVGALLERAHLLKKIRIAHVCVELLETTWRLGIGTRRAIRRSRDVEWID